MLDPERPDANAPSIKAEWDINPPLRDFGYFPDINKIKPGDLILTSPVRPEWSSSAISAFQSHMGYQDEHAQWTHAAVYIGDGRGLCEANTNGWKGSVQIADIGDYCADHKIKVRRPMLWSPEEEWESCTLQEAWQIVIRAMRQIGHPYDHAKLWRIWWSFRGEKRQTKGDNTQRGSAQAFICSTLYADALAWALGGPIGEGQGVCTPAFLSGTKRLADIPISWCKLEV